MSKVHKQHSDIFIVIRSLYIWGIGVVAITTTCFLIFLAFLLRRRYKLHKYIAYWVRFLLYISGTNLTIEGKENFYKKGHVIILSNHASMADIPVLYATIETSFAWIAKQSLFSLPFIGWGLKMSGSIPIERSDNKMAYQALYKASEHIAKQQNSIVIFPEGARSFADGTMRPFKKGAFFIALHSKVPLQPITIQNTRNIIPKQKGKWIQRIYPGNVRITIHPCIHTEKYRNKDVTELSDRVRATISSIL